ncbi:MAG: hypothetical protein AAGI34_14145 [Pseudomonadota bacterium]
MNTTLQKYPSFNKRLRVHIQRKLLIIAANAGIQRGLIELDRTSGLWIGLTGEDQVSFDLEVLGMPAVATFRNQPPDDEISMAITVDPTKKGREHPFLAAHYNSGLKDLGAAYARAWFNRQAHIGLTQLDYVDQGTWCAPHLRTAIDALDPIPLGYSAKMPRLR